MKKNLNILPLFLILFSILIGKSLFEQSIKTRYVSYDDFFKSVKSKEISEVIVTQDTLKGVVKDKESKVNFIITNQVEPDVAQKLENLDVKFSQVNESTFLRDILSWVIPPLIFVFIWIYFMRKMASKSMGGSLMSVGKSKAKVYVEKDTGISFKDVAGVDEAKDELKEIVDFLTDSKRFTRLGGRIPKGVLLVGPPGTGKTMLAKAVAGEAKVPFYSISGSEFVEMFVGVGAARVRDLFEQAKQHSPCIIFIDELDALGKARGFGGNLSGNDEKEQTLNQLLTELDGFDTRESIVLLGATNRPEILDPALLRSGRFDRQVLVDRPDKRGRIEILQVHIKKIKHSTEVDLEKVASLTTGFTGADLANLVNEAALAATRRDAETVETQDFQNALERIVAGLEKRNRILNDFERNVTAHHEMGHAIVGMALKGDTEIHKVSIIPRGIGALGYTIQRPTEDRFLMRKEELENKICVLLGGRAAEKLIFNHFSTGASDDLVKATDIANSMVTRYGMCEEIGHVSFEKNHFQFLEGSHDGRRNYSEQTAREIDLAVKNIIDECFYKTINILTKNEQILRDSAQALLVQETLEGEALSKYAKKLTL